MNAMYIGSFDPFTLGHLEVVSQALEKKITISKLYPDITQDHDKYDKLFICVGDNIAKTPMFSQQERKRFIELAIQDLPRAKDITVITSYELTVDIAHEYNIDVLIRGTRSGSADLYQKKQLAETNQILGYTRGMFLPTDFFELDSLISSTTVRQLLQKKEYIAARLYLPQSVFLEILEKELTPVYEKAAKSACIPRIPHTWKAFKKKYLELDEPLTLTQIAYQYNMLNIYEKFGEHTPEYNNMIELKQLIILSLFLEASFGFTAIYAGNPEDIICDIIATRKKSPSCSPIFLVEDIRRSVLSIPSDVIIEDYKAYIRQENPNYSDENFRQEISNLLKQKPLFQTTFFQNLLERQTRSSLTQQLKKLQNLS